MHDESIVISHANLSGFQDFSKWRELHLSRRGSKALGQSVQIYGNPTLTAASQQQRSFFSLTNSISNKVATLQLKGLETVANSRPADAQAQYDFLSKLGQSHPQAVVERASHPMFRDFAIDRRIALLYLQALGQTQRYSLFNLDELSSRMQEHDPNIIGLSEFTEEARKLNKQEQATGLLNLLSGGPGMTGLASLGAATAASPAAALQQSRGADAKSPLHVQLHNPTSTRAALLSLSGRVLIAFVVVSALSALLDEKGVGRGLGMNSGSKHIQQAQDTSNVSFDDVKGVEEAKAELQEIVMYLKNPAKFTRLGGKLPRGLLLTGPVSKLVLFGFGIAVILILTTLLARNW